jgi:hypothetical protein
MNLNFLKLLPFFGAKTLEDHKTAPAIEGFVKIETREGGKRRQYVEGKNIWTLTGREYLSELIALRVVTPRDTFRNDRIAFIGMGGGSQAEVANISSLVDPLPYAPAEFLARVKTPATFPASASSSARTAVRFVREYGQTELSLGATAILTEAGLFTDGDPDSDWDTSSPITGFSASSDRAPMAYKTFEPVSKTSAFTLRVIWEVRFL